MYALGESKWISEPQSTYLDSIAVFLKTVLKAIVRLRLLGCTMAAIFSDVYTSEKKHCATCSY